MDLSDFNFLIETDKSKTTSRLVIANGTDTHSIEAAHIASKMKLVEVSITGKKDDIIKSCGKLSISTDWFTLINCDNQQAAIEKAVEMCRSGNADLIMKGLLNTDRFMRALLNKQTGLLPPGTLLSHVTVIQNRNYPKPLLVSDVAIIPQPTLDQKAIITGYLIDVAHKIGIAEPKVAFVAATEQIIPKMQATVDAFELKRMWEDGLFPNSVCDGPMGLDLAIDEESVKIKKFESPVAGKSDCLLFPNIETGNVFYKTNTKLCRAQTAAILVGTTVPAVLSSRGDSMETKLNSIALAAKIG
ncbi:MAG: hypothetical protein K9H26_12890 [Prolixibacteraceae bacterium]|nr:hypothetical protein [Prolixibacteraceae bacterium]